MADQAGPGANYVLKALELFAGYGDREAIVTAGARLSYAQLRSDTLSFAAALREHGVKPGAGVGVLVNDRAESAALHLALHLLGCRTIWIASYAPPPDQARFFTMAEAEVLIYSASPHREQLARMLAGEAGPVPLLCLGPGGGGPDLLAALGRRASLDLAQAGPPPESLFYTGGTTGQPKLVHHGQAFYQALLMIAAYYLSVGEPPMRFLYGASFTHVAGQMPAFLTLFEGGTLFLDEGYDPAVFLATIEREAITSAFLTPALLYQVLDHPDVRTADTSSLRYLNVGGGPAAPARLTEAIERFGPVIRIVYGSSEAPLITDLPFLDHDPGHPERLSSAGRPFADTAIEIRDAGGAACPAGQPGEVWVRGSLLMSGYWRQPELTAQAMTGGWLRTGDVGYLDADGYLFLVDRVSDMIVTGISAANVYARPIEDVLASHPQVRAAAVIGVPDEAEGEAVHALVVAAPGAQVTAAQLRELVAARLNELYTPREIEFVTELPLTPVAKVDKKLLRERYRAARAAAES
ncbi:MAG TPA: AMP-binding protein [Streptosporangiaceae bacterium]|jgi:acyl-CoA synthetase (AMP-forming)/AMP-acid ligase II